MDDSKNIEGLFKRYFDNQCSPDEIRLLLQHFNAGENEDLLRSLIREQSNLIQDAPFISDESSKPLLDTVFRKIQNAIAVDNKIRQITVLPFYRNSWFRACAAATIILIISTTTYYFLHKSNETVFALKQTPIHQAKDIPPGTNNAVLTLDNGTTIMLDSAANGTLAQQGNTDVQKTNGQIAYRKTDMEMNTKPVYNTITTANGNQYQLILTDGSKVWLNAASSIRFPTAFTGDERKVEITGEAYFEVAKDVTKPFRVEFDNQAGGKGEVEVLGTHFNINAYPDEPNSKTTLLEGSVKIKNANSTQMLSPGQQALLSPAGISFKKDIDVSQVVAWKDGYFVFDNVDIHTLMRQVQRWYDVDVSFDGKISEDGYTGKISRDVPLSKFLHVLELNEIHIKTEGRKVVITP